MKYYIDIMKWPRPERSGVLAVLIAFTVLWAYGDLFVPHDAANSLREISLKCTWFPWWPSCEKQPECKATKDEIRKHYRIILLHPGIKAKKKVCACHFDMRYFGKPIKHLYYEPLEACDSDYAEPRDWTEPQFVSDGKSAFDDKTWRVHSVGVRFWNLTTGESFEMNHGEGEYRYHCE